MEKSLIISRYNEDLEWLQNINGFQINIYNKGPEIKYKFSNITKLKNVGRESHTWLYHIVNHYDKLGDLIIFQQGRIDDLGCMAFNNPEKYEKIIDKYGFAASRYGLLGPFHWSWNVGIEKNIKYKKDWEQKNISRSKVGFRNFAKELFPEIPIFVATSYGGCFAVKKESIKLYKIDFYEQLLKILSKNKNPIEGHYLERLWCYMFTKNKPIIEACSNVFLTKFERLFLNRFLKN